MLELLCIGRVDLGNAVDLIEQCSTIFLKSVDLDECLLDRFCIRTRQVCHESLYWESPLTEMLCSAASDIVCDANILHLTSCLVNGPVYRRRLIRNFWLDSRRHL